MAIIYGLAQFALALLLLHTGTKTLLTSPAFQTFLSFPIIHALWHNWPLTLGTFLYMYQMMIFWWDKNLGGAIMFFGYTVGNVGIMVGVIMGAVVH